jgi:hypothetical protein
MLAAIDLPIWVLLVPCLGVTVAAVAMLVNIAFRGNDPSVDENLVRVRGNSPLTRNGRSIRG